MAVGHFSTNNNNTQNNNFNLNFFLNEQCKNAMNITDFVKSIEIEVEDVANVGKLGYVEGITRIVTKALNNLDVYERPIHCSDLKREVMYVKDNGIGIPKELQSKTFRIFKRLHTQDEYGGGTGIGLTIVSKIINQHNGDIWVDSIEHEGTTFNFNH